MHPQSITPSLQPCLGCGRVIAHRGHGLCGACYMRQWRKAPFPRDHQQAQRRGEDPDGRAILVIPLNHGQETMISAEDWPLVAHLHWYAKLSRQGNYYAVAGLGRQDGKKVSVRLHRLLLQAPRGIQVDHRNHNTLDNRRANLRLATHTQNQHNRRGATSRSRTGVLNVRQRPGGTYVAEITANGRRWHLGSHAILEAAAAAAQAARAALMPFAEETE